MIILAIETSCDETAAALVQSTPSGLVEIHSEVVASSENMHSKTGGIVPEIAAREQLQSIIQVIQQTISQAITLEQKTKSSSKAQFLDDKNDPATINAWVRDHVDAIAVTQGPGLIGSLLVGVETAKTLAYAWKKPLIPVNHLHGHIYANWLVSPSQISHQTNDNTPQFPLLTLIVSGGHTELFFVTSHSDFVLIGESRDDAAGECFDKCARLLDLPYPGGPHLAKLASMSISTKQPINSVIKFPRPLLYDDSLDFSFSGLKAAFSREVKVLSPLSEFKKTLLAYELQSSIVEVITKKVDSAIEKYQPQSLLLAGGVAANQAIRDSLEIICKKKQLSFFKPQHKHCVDNAAMIGAAAFFQNHPREIDLVKADPSLSLKHL